MDYFEGARSVSNRPKNYANLDFPLNVFAYCLCAEEGKVDYLHYGLFEATETLQHAQLAQQRSTDFLIARLPPPPCRILEVGVGFGTSAKLLIERGYQVTGISPDAAQIDLAKQRVSEKVNLQCTTLQALAPDETGYDVILMQESAQYIETLALFNKAQQLLNEGGCLLIADEVALRREADDDQGLPLVDYTVAQAQRCGFELHQQVDLSTQAAPSVDYLLAGVAKYRARLLADLNLTPGALDDLASSLRQYRQKYRDGRYGYVFLQFLKTHVPRWQITLVSEQESQAVCALFDEVFQPKTMSQAFWAWKYRPGRCLSTAAWRDNKMVAHFGGIKREILYYGTPKWAVQLADVMVSPKDRSILTRRGALFLIEATFLEKNIGYGAHTWIGYGFPNDLHLKLAQKLGLLGLHDAVGRKIVEIGWSATTGRPSMRSRIRHLIPTQEARNRAILDQLWQEMQPGLQHAIVGVRNWDYIQYRYQQHPHFQYELLLISGRLTGKPLGVAVIFRDQEICQIRDYIGDIKEIPEVVRQVRRMAGNWGMRQVKLWISDNFVDVFPPSEMEPVVTTYVPHNTWSKYLPPEQPEGHWWLMSGDTDFL